MGRSFERFLVLWTFVPRSLILRGQSTQLLPDRRPNTAAMKLRLCEANPGYGIQSSNVFHRSC